MINLLIFQFMIREKSGTEVPVLAIAANHLSLSLDSLFYTFKTIHNFDAMRLCNECQKFCQNENLLPRSMSLVLTKVREQFTFAIQIRLRFN